MSTEPRQYGESVRKVAGYVCVSKQMAEDIRLMQEAMSRPVLAADWEAWLAEEPMCPEEETA